MTDPLVGVPTYRRVTGDGGGDDDTITAALAEAEQLVGEHCRRGLAQGERTETLRVDPRGRAYPAAAPIDSVSAPAGARIDGAAVLVAPSDLPQPWDGLAGAGPREVTITYVGGWTTGTLPVKLRRAIARIAYMSLHPAVLPANVPVGASRVAVGDVSLGGDLSQFLVIDPSLRADLRGYVRRLAKG